MPWVRIPWEQKAEVEAQGVRTLVVPPLFVDASTEGGLSNAVLEAMAMGCCVIASRAALGGMEAELGFVTFEDFWAGVPCAGILLD